MKKKYYKYIYFSLLLFLIIVIGRVDFFNSTLRIFILSFFIYYILTPIFNYLNKRINSRKISAILVILIFLGVITFMMVNIIPVVLKESGNVLNTIDEVDDKFTNILNSLNYIEKNDFLYNMMHNVNTYIYEISYKISGDFFQKIGDISGDFVDYIVIPIITYYIFVDIIIIKKKLLKLFPTNYRTIINKICSDSDKMLKRYIYSQFVLVLIITMFTSIILRILGIKYSLLLGILNGIFNIIPYFGPIIGAIPPILIALLESTNKAILVSIVLFVIQFIEGNIISPKITGDSIFLHPLIVISVLLISGKIAGVWGMILAVPITVVIKIIIYDIDYYLY